MLTNTKSPVTHNAYRAHLKEKISASQKQSNLPARLRNFLQLP